MRRSANYSSRQDKMFLVQICIADVIFLGDCCIVLTLTPYSYTRSGSLYLWSEFLPNAMPPVTLTSCLFSPPVKNPLKCPASLALADLMISELSAGCECRLFGTGLVMSENASDCTQNAALRDRKLKKFYGDGAKPLPHTPRRLDPRALGARPSASHFHHLPPPPSSHFWLRAWETLLDHAQLRHKMSHLSNLLVFLDKVTKCGGCG